MSGETRMLLLLSNAIYLYTHIIFTMLMLLEISQSQTPIEELTKLDLRLNQDSLLWVDGRHHGVRDTISLLRSICSTMNKTQINLCSVLKSLISLKESQLKTLLSKSYFLKVHPRFRWIFLLKWSKLQERFTDTLTWEEDELKLNLEQRIFIDSTTIRKSPFHTD